MKALVVGLLLLITFGNTAQAAQTTPLTELQSSIRDMINEVDDWSVGVAIVDENGLVWAEGIGQGNLPEGRDVNEHTMFRIGSISKMFVGLTALKLIEQGKITLDTKLADIAPEIPVENPWQATHPLTLRHFLEHSSGFEDIHLAQFKSYPPEMTLQEGLTFHPDSQISRWPPGKAYSYSNANTSVAAYMLQKVSGVEFEALVKQLIFDPMGMQSATYKQDERMKTQGVNLLEPYSSISVRPSGAVNISPTDLAKLLEMLINKGQFNGQQIFSPSDIKTMETPTSTLGAIAGIETGYSITNMGRSYEGWRTQGHGGAISQNIASLQYFPDAKSGFVLMANKSQQGQFRKIEKLLKEYLTKELEAPKIPQGVTIQQSTKAIEGYYYPVNFRNEWMYFAYWIMSIQHFSFDGDQLHSQSVFGGRTDKYLGKNQQQFFSEKSGLVEVVQINDEIMGQGLYQKSILYLPINPFVWAVLLLTLVLALISILLSAVYAILLAPFSLRKKLTNQEIEFEPKPTIRRWPMFSSLAFSLSFLMMYIGINDALVLLANPTWASIGLMVGTLLFAILSWVAFYKTTALYQQRNKIKFYWYWTIVSFCQLCFSIYLTWHGFIGIMIWR